MATRSILRSARILATRPSSISVLPPFLQKSSPASNQRIFSRRNSSIGPNVSQLGILCHAGSHRSLSSKVLDDSLAGILMDVPLAQTGEGIVECELLKWFVEEGDHVEEFQPLCEVQSDKATMEITSRFKGKVHQIVCGHGDVVKVGETMLKILINVSRSDSTSEEDDSDSSHVFLPIESEPQISVNSEPIPRVVLATPAVRHLAKQHDIRINDVTGTGKDGRVLKEDVMSYYNGSESAPKDSPFLPLNSDLFEEGKLGFMASMQQWSYEDKVLPLRGFQRSMAKSMAKAATVPHFYYMEEIKCDALVELKAAFQKDNNEANVKHTFVPFLIKSLSMALNKYPMMNSSFNEESSEIILKGCHNIGVAMATPYGLVVPNVKKVQSKSILEITKELAKLQQLAGCNKLTSGDITEGTITLSNIGSIGGKFGSPILNLPEASIIAIGKIQKLPRYSEDDELYPTFVTNVTIGADHRVADGATVARFCNEWKLLIEKPELLLLHMR